EVLRKASLNQLPNQRHGQRLLWLEADGPFTGVESFQFAFIRTENGSTHEIESTMVCSRTECDQRLSIQAERRQLIADAFLGIRHRGPDHLPQSFEREALLRLHGRQIFIDRFW